MPVLNEMRTITAHRASDLGASLVTWSARLSVAGKAPVNLTGESYVGLGMRFLPAMDAGGRFITPDGKRGEVIRGAMRVLRAPSCAPIQRPPMVSWSQWPCSTTPGIRVIRPRCLPRASRSPTFQQR